MKRRPSTSRSSQSKTARLKATQNWWKTSRRAPTRRRGSKARSYSTAFLATVQGDRHGQEPTFHEELAGWRMGAYPGSTGGRHNQGRARRTPRRQARIRDRAIVNPEVRGLTVY